MMIATSSLTALHQNSERESRASIRSLTLCAFYTNTKWPASHTVKTRCQLKLVLKWAKSPGWHWGPVGKQLFTSSLPCECACVCVWTVQHMHLCVCVCVCTIYICCCVLPLTRAVSLPPYLIMTLQPAVAWLHVSVSWCFHWCFRWLFCIRLINLQVSGQSAILKANI